jgi:hypothetical protein
VLADGAVEVSVAEPAILAVPALCELAADPAADVAATLTLARAAAARVARDSDRDQALNQSAQAWARHGDPPRALETAAEIGGADQAGEAMLAAALAIVRGDAAGWPAALTIINAMTSPIWRAAGLAVAGAAKADAREYFAEVDRLLGQVPEGDPRSRAQRGIIEIALESGDYDVALRAARAVTVRRAEVVGMLAHDLAARGAVDAMKSLLQDCARQEDSAHAACIALAHAIPAQAAAIAAAVANLPS